MYAIIDHKTNVGLDFSALVRQQILHFQNVGTRG